MKINLEQIKTNAQLIKSKGLDEKIIKISKEAYEEAKKRTAVSYGITNTHILSEKPIAEILGLFGGSVKEINVLDLGCGNGRTGEGNYLPILSTALAYLGANVTGIDYTNSRDDEQRKIVSERWGFQYKEMDLTKIGWGLSDLDYYLNKKIEFFKNKDLIIARSLLNYGLEQFSLPASCRHFESDFEWRFYAMMIHGIQKLNAKDSVYNLEIPHYNNFRYDTREIYEKPIDDKEKNKLVNDYLTNQFELEFGKIIYGNKNSGQQVFTIKKY